MATFDRTGLYRTKVKRMKCFLNYNDIDMIRRKHRLTKKIMTEI